MNGAEKLLQNLVASGVEVCFANPGTSEMQLVSAIGNTQEMRAVLCLFEGVVSGAADGFARMADRPALTLLHVGCGFSNSMANQHNAKRAHVPLVNIVGDHATYHLPFDAPLTSDVPAQAKICSDWVKVSESADDLAAGGVEAVQASMKGWGKIATLIAPANHSWEEATPVKPDRSTTSPPLTAWEEPSGVTISEATEALANGKTTALFLGGRALREECLGAAGRIARATGARILCETFSARLQRGAGRVPVERLPYFAEQAQELLHGVEHLVLVGARAPVSFFAYPGMNSLLAPENCALITLAGVDQNVGSALDKVATALGAFEPPVTPIAGSKQAAPSGVLSPLAIALSLAQLMPDNAIVSDEAATCGLAMFPATQNTRPHDWLTITGGAIGQGLPLSLGAAIACPDRKVIALQADGSAMYTVQALWSMARENTDITVVIMNNRSYAILNIELARVGAGQATPKTQSMFDLSKPDINWVEMAQSMGVPATRATSAEEFHHQFSEAIAAHGPRLIEAMVIQ